MVMMDGEKQLGSAHLRLAVPADVEHAHSIPVKSEPPLCFSHDGIQSKICTPTTIYLR